MKITGSPLGAIKTQAETDINQHFDYAGGAGKWQSLTHSIKQATAQAVLDGGAVPETFAAAAAIEGLSPADLAALIVSKTNQVMQKENERRKAVLAVRASQSAPEISAIVQTVKASSNG